MILRLLNSIEITGKAFKLTRNDLNRTLSNKIYTTTLLPTYSNMSPSRLHLIPTLMFCNSIKDKLENVPKTSHMIFSRRNEIDSQIGHSTRELPRANK